MITVNNTNLFNVYRIMEYHRDPDWHMDRTDRPYTIFWMVLSGGKCIEVGNVKYEAEQGDLVVFPANLSFAVFKSNSNGMHHLDLALENKFGSFDLLNLYKFPVITKIADPRKAEKIRKLWTQLIERWSPLNKNHASPDNEAIFNLSDTMELLHINSLCLQWFSEIMELLRPYVMETSPVVDMRLQKAVLYISEHLSEKISLKTLANHVFLSESNLGLLFRQKLKTSPMEYVRQVRLKKARELLLTTNYRLKEIAEIVGFGEPSQLSRAFRQAVGVSPAQYRRNSETM